MGTVGGPAVTDEATEAPEVDAVEPAASPVTPAATTTAPATTTARAATTTTTPAPAKPSEASLELAGDVGAALGSRMSDEQFKLNAGQLRSALLAENMNDPAKVSQAIDKAVREGAMNAQTAKILKEANEKAGQDNNKFAELLLADRSKLSTALALSPSGAPGTPGATAGAPGGMNGIMNVLISLIRAMFDPKGFDMKNFSNDLNNALQGLNGQQVAGGAGQRPGAPGATGTNPAATTSTPTSTRPTTTTPAATTTTPVTATTTPAADNSAGSGITLASDRSPYSLGFGGSNIYQTSVLATQSPGLLNTSLTDGFSVGGQTMPTRFNNLSFTPDYTVVDPKRDFSLTPNANSEFSLTRQDTGIKLGSPSG